MSRFAQKAVALGSALTLAMSLVGSAFAADPTPTTSTVVQQTTQVASNTAIVIQAGSATSGAAVAGPGTTARSGDAETTLQASVNQNVNQTADTSSKNVAVAGEKTTVAASTVQAGSNTANLQQTGTSASGTAVATGKGADASSGNAEAQATASQTQRINQSAETEAAKAVAAKTSTLAASSTVQLASNTAVDFQTVAAASGAAVAVGRGAEAESGNAEAEATLRVHQFIDQSAETSAEGALTAGSAVIAAQSSTQAASNVADAAQLAVAVSGPAVAIVVDGIKFDGLEFVRSVEATSGDAESEVTLDQFQDIDQTAETMASMFGAIPGTDNLGGTLPTGALAATSVTQLASNTSILFQTGIAVTGAAAATQIDGGTPFALDSIFGSVEATSGDAEVSLFIDDDQAINQEAFNTLKSAFTLGAILISTQSVGQAETNFDCVPTQLGTAVSGTAISIGNKFDTSPAISGDVEVENSIFKSQGFDNHGKVDPQLVNLLNSSFIALQWPLFIGFGL